MADPKKRPGKAPEAGVLGEIQAEAAVEAAPMLKFIATHARAIVALLIVLVGAIAATGLYQWRQAGSQREAGLALGRILTGPEGAQRVAALEGHIPDLPASMRPGGWFELAVAAREAGDYAKAAEAFGRLADADATGFRVMALLDQSDMLLKAGNAEQALKVLEGPAGGGEAWNLGAFTNLVVQEAVAVAAETAGDAKRAIEAYTKLAEMPGAESAYYRARIAALETDGAGAR
jgi:cytochrome c-type biogenesis protein CcmH/NrfG